MQLHCPETTSKSYCRENSGIYPFRGQKIPKKNSPRSLSIQVYGFQMAKIINKV